MKSTKSNSRTKTTESFAVSVSPSGEVFPLPSDKDYEKEFKRLQKIVGEQRKLNREIVVVMGVGFVGSVMAGIVADAETKAPSTKFTLPVTP